MQILTWNVNGIRAASKKGFLKFLQKEQPDILCLQEIKSHEDAIPDELKNISGYHCFWNPAEKKGYAGTAIISKNKPMEVVLGIGKKEFDSQGRVMIAKYPGFTLFNLYFPHGQRDKARIPFKIRMYDDFLNYLKNHKLNKNTIICGDFNVAHEEVDLARPKENKNNTMFTPEERKQVSRLIEAGFVDTFRKFNNKNGNYTWWPYYRNARARNLGWRIDYVFVSNDMEKNLKKTFILPKVMGSDHCPAGIEINN